jgi:predicted peroxiredoxin
MNTIKKFGIILALVCTIALPNTFAGESGKSLFVNLSSDDVNRATMAIGFGTRVLKEKKIPVTIFLNVEGVRIADKNISGPTHANGKAPQKMLAAFIKAGGKVIVCPMCMKNVGGLTKDEIIDGAVIGGSDVTWPALFADGTTVLSY